MWHAASPSIRADEGPMVHCVVWHDGDKWRAALDTSDMYPPGSEKGRLADFAPLTNYRDERRHGTFTPLDSNNFALNIYQNGDVLSIVTDASPHGTHVAAIAAAHHPEDPSPNGGEAGAGGSVCVPAAVSMQVPHRTGKTSFPRSGPRRADHLLQDRRLEARVRFAVAPEHRLPG